MSLFTSDEIANGENCIIAEEKIRDYCLSSSHPRGKHKARVFEIVLGIGDRDTEILITAIKKAVIENEAIISDSDVFGRRYLVDFDFVGNTGTAKVRSCWIIRTGEENPRLTSCYIL